MGSHQLPGDIEGFQRLSSNMSDFAAIERPQSIASTVQTASVCSTADSERRLLDQADDTSSFVNLDLGSAPEAYSAHPYLKPDSEDDSRAEKAQLAPTKLRSKEPWPALWSWEIFGSLMSIACMVAIVAILGAMDGKPRDHWTLRFVTPNALIAVFSTIAKSSMLMAVAGGIGQLKWVYFQKRPRRLAELQTFEDASHGPLGSFRLMMSIRCRSFLALAGALITIAALSMDFLTQQVISYNSHTLVSKDLTATIGQAHSYLGYNDFGYNYSDVSGKSGLCVI